MEKRRITVYGFVTMPNRIHIIWLILPPFKREEIQRDFLKYIAHNIKKELKANHQKY